MKNIILVKKDVFLKVTGTKSYALNELTYSSNRGGYGYRPLLYYFYFKTNKGYAQIFRVWSTASLYFSLCKVGDDYEKVEQWKTFSMICEYEWFYSKNIAPSFSCENTRDCWFEKGATGRQYHACFILKLPSNQVHGSLLWEI